MQLLWNSLISLIQGPSVTRACTLGRYWAHGRASGETTARSRPPHRIRRRTRGGARPIVRDRFGTHIVLREHVGGMSPGCATSLATADGGRVFIKAVGPELHERTTELFRREAELLRRLPDVCYCPPLLDGFGVGGWVALCFQHIDGHHPDLTDERGRQPRSNGNALPPTPPPRLPRASDNSSRRRRPASDTPTGHRHLMAPASQ